MARELGVSRKTVGRYLEQSEPAHRRRVRGRYTRGALAKFSSFGYRPSAPETEQLVANLTNTLDAFAHACPYRDGNFFIFHNSPRSVRFLL